MRENVSINISARHVHLTKEAVDILIGHDLTVRNPINQKGQFACNETVRIKTLDGVIENVRVIGPVREYNQVEISMTDARGLGIKPPVRKSGDVLNSEMITIETEKGKITGEYCIIAERHVHFSLEDAKKYNVVDGDVLHLKIGGIKPGEIEVKAAVSESGFYEVHLDTDDANAFLINPGDIGSLYK